MEQVQLLDQMIKRTPNHMMFYMYTY